ncbi:MAG: YjgN family protein [Hyphomicrobium sp.]|jgi:uncharacterized membrane protein YjgN (DUF898 family)
MNDQNGPWSEMWSEKLLPGAAAPQQLPPATPLTLSWQPPRGLLDLCIVNLFLKLMTLGVYGFWAKTEVRKRIWSAVRINGEPLQYTGTGKELLLGFAIIFGLILLPVILVSYGVVAAYGNAAAGPAQLATYALFFVLTGVGIYRAQRYRLSRTRWRAIQGSLPGSSLNYAWTYVWTALLIPLTAGWIIPWRTTKLQELITRDMHFGNHPFRFTAGAGPLYLRFAILWFMALILIVAAIIGVTAVSLPEIDRYRDTLGKPSAPSPQTIASISGILVLSVVVYSVLSAWYRAHQQRHFAAHTHFDEATFASTVTARGLIWIGVTNILMVVATLGILSPIAQARSARYVVDNLSIKGRVNLADVLQGAAEDIKRGEGLAQVFDIDAF